MGARIPQFKAILLDMSAPFGWSGSPSYYGAFGGAISWLLSRASPASMTGDSSADTETFFAYEWVDDHVLVEVDIPLRLHCANEALRLAMIAVLGPRAINEDKFTAWGTVVEVLGLVFDTQLRTVSMPPSKIAKALDRVVQLAASSRVSRHDLDCLLGSLRHVCSCLRAAKPFFQRVQVAAKRAPRRGRINLAEAVQCDLRWFRSILVHGHWTGLPLSMFCGLPPPSVHLYMDASDDGLAFMDPANRRYIRLQFDEEERASFTSAGASRGFDINARELFCAALAAVLWGHEWTPPLANHVTHVRAWSDHSSAVSWINKLISDNPFAQELIRAIGFSEATHRLRLSACHLPGSINIMADAGSRCHDASLRSLWTNFVSSWSQTPVPSSTRKLYKTFSMRYKSKLWPSESPKVCSDVASMDGVVHERRTVPVALWGPPPRLWETRQLRDLVLATWTRAPSKFCIHHHVKLGHISWHHRRYLVFPVGLHSGHQLALQGMQRLSTPPSPKLPFTTGLLRRFRARCDFSSAHDRVLWGAAVMGYFYMLRRSEYLSDRGAVKPYAIQVGDVTFRTRSGEKTSNKVRAHSVTIHFRGSKTDQEGRSAARTLERSGSRWLCPVLAVWELVQQARRLGLQEGAFLCTTSKNSSISATTMTTAIRATARDAGENPDQYGTHSMRSGGATALFGAGADRHAIKHFGRWRSDCYEQYARIDNITLQGIATAMATESKQYSNSQARLRHNGAAPRRTLGSSR